MCLRKTVTNATAYKHIIERSELLRTVLLRWRLHLLDRHHLSVSSLHVSKALCLLTTVYEQNCVLGNILHAYVALLHLNFGRPKHDAQHVPVNQP